MADSNENSNQDSFAAAAPQPDFAALSGHAQGLATQFERVANIPGLRDLQTLAETITVHMDSRFDSLNGRLDSLTAQLNEIKTQLKTSDQNSLARIQNSHLSNPRDRLTPLMNPMTNEEIVNFPTTSEDINSLSHTELGRLLATLGASHAGSNAQKIQNLRVALGLSQVRQSVTTTKA
ncbi:MAG: hypothetical protein M1821_003670 [Bathelium mastoideum]|nr:MAG: hypothetical protein M1821_003670 [Bathelium mastoideum]